MKTASRSIAVVGSLCASMSVAALAAPARREARRLPAPAHLSPAVRAVVRTQMAHHSRDMNELVWAVVFLDYPGVVVIAERMAASPALARPLTSDATDLNAALPAHFFTLQTDLKTAAKSLARAAATRDSAMLAETYGQFARSCVSCHAAYLETPRPDAPPAAR